MISVKAPFFFNSAMASSLLVPSNGNFSERSPPGLAASILLGEAFCFISKALLLNLSACVKLFERVIPYSFFFTTGGSLVLAFSFSQFSTLVSWNPIACFNFFMSSENSNILNSSWATSSLRYWNFVLSSSIFKGLSASPVFLLSCDSFDVRAVIGFFALFTAPRSTVSSAELSLDSEEVYSGISASLAREGFSFFIKAPFLESSFTSPSFFSPCNSWSFFVDVNFCEIRKCPFENEAVFPSLESSDDTFVGNSLSPTSLLSL